MDQTTDTLEWHPASKPKPAESFALAEVLHNYVVVPPCEGLPVHAIQWAPLRPPAGEGEVYSCTD